MSTGNEKKYIWSSEREKKPTEMVNNGELLTEQKSGTTIEEIVVEMMQNGTWEQIARMRNATTAKSVDEAMETATKLPRLLTKIDFKEAMDKQAEFELKLKELEKDQAEWDKLVKDMETHENTGNETLPPKTEE